MKRCTFFLIFIFFVITSFSQTTQLKVDENTIVKDSGGTVYPYKVWQALVFNGYGLKPEDPTNKKTDFILFRLTEKQITDRMERTPKPKESLYFTTGKKMSFSNVSDINGKKIKLRDEVGKIIVLNFWFINCAPCRMEIPELNEMVEKYKGNDSVLFIAVALDKRWDLQDFLKQIPFNYTIIDDGKYIADRYSIKSFPTHVIVDTEGKVYFHTSGVGTNTVYWLKKSIDELLKPSNLTKN